MLKSIGAYDSLWPGPGRMSALSQRGRAPNLGDSLWHRSSSSSAGANAAMLLKSNLMPEQKQMH